jgi:hypothetical protein
MISTEKLKASAKATASQSDCLFTIEMIIIIKQKMLTTTVSAFFSDKYLFIRLAYGYSLKWWQIYLNLCSVSNACR